MDNVQKTPLAMAINTAAQRKVRDAISQLGRALPASVVEVTGSIVRVKFEVDASPFTLPTVTVPVQTPEYIRLPIQVGDKGIVLPCDAPIGNMSGLGGGTPKLSLIANLSSLTWFPIGNSGWSAATDPNKIELYGPDGAILRNRAGDSKLEVSNTDITITANGDVILTPKTGGKVYLGGAAGALAVARNGDAVVLGHVVSSSTEVFSK